MRGRKSFAKARLIARRLLKSSSSIRKRAAVERNRDVRARIAAQIDPAEARGRADFMIDNGGDLDHLRANDRNLRRVQRSANVTSRSNRAKRPPVTWQKR